MRPRCDWTSLIPQEYERFVCQIHVRDWPGWVGRWEFGVRILGQIRWDLFSLLRYIHLLVDAFLALLLEVLGGQKWGPDAANSSGV